MAAQVKGNDLTAGDTNTSTAGTQLTVNTSETWTQNTYIFEADGSPGIGSAGAAVRGVHGVGSVGIVQDPWDGTGVHGTGGSGAGVYGEGTPNPQSNIVPPIGYGVGVYGQGSEVAGKIRGIGVNGNGGPSTDLRRAGPGVYGQGGLNTNNSGNNNPFGAVGVWGQGSDATSNPDPTAPGPGVFGRGGRSTSTTVGSGVVGYSGELPDPDFPQEPIPGADPIRGHAGVVGQSWDGTGVIGESRFHTGVIGHGLNKIGLYGQSGGLADDALVSLNTLNHAPGGVFSSGDISPRLIAHTNTTQARSHNGIAQIRLIPAENPTFPTTGQIGDIIMLLVTTDLGGPMHGELWVCTQIQRATAPNQNDTLTWHQVQLSPVGVPGGAPVL